MLKYALVFSLLFSTFFAEAPKQKVIYLTIPKAGTHLLKKAIELLTEKESRWIALSETRFFSPTYALASEERIIGGHLFPELDIIRTRFSDRYRKILMIRDPRDVMISFMHHLHKKMTWSGCPQFDYNAFAQLGFDQRLRIALLFPYEYRNPACTFSYAALWMQDPTVFVCRFEDLVGAHGGGSQEKQRNVMRALAQFLSLERTDAEINALSDRLYGGTWTFREGQIGSWKELYSQENKQLFKELMGQSVIDLGYAEDLSW